MTTRIGILVFEGVDLLDVGGPYEVFLTAARLEMRRGRSAPFEVAVVGATGEPVTAYGGMGLVPTHTVADMGSIGVAVIPGAIDIDRVTADASNVDAVAALTSAASVASSVCTGAFLLGDAGLLDGRPWTTHWEDVDDLAARIGAGHATRARWVDSGEVVTAGGLSSGMAMALHLVDRLEGRELAIATARQLDYVWDPEDGVASI
jgi:transcriptional regulator GlxA family with amidase domain